MTYKRLTLLLMGIMLAVVPVLHLRPAAAQGDRLQVVASFSILADVARIVAGDAADVVSLMPVGANPHAYAPSAQDVVTLSEADVVLVVGINFEEGLLPVLEESAGEKMAIASQCVPVRPVVSSHAHEDDAHENEEHGHAEDDHPDEACPVHHQFVTRAFGLDEHTLEDGTLGPLHTLECAGHEDEAHEGEHVHEVGSCDPHVWTDPANVALWALMIADTLSQLDPEHSTTYVSNAHAYIEELATLHTDIQAQIDAIPAENRYIVTNHLAFNYFAVRYGLELVGVVIPGGSTTSEPSVQDVLALIETIQDYDVPAIFTETTVSEDLARQVADESGAEIVRLYTGSLSEPGGDAGTYLDYMRFNASQIAGALK